LQKSAKEEKKEEGLVIPLRVTKFQKIGSEKEFLGVLFEDYPSLKELQNALSKQITTAVSSKKLVGIHCTLTLTFV